MKTVRMLRVLLLLLIIDAEATLSQTVYHGSTPAGEVVRNFLAVSHKDSVDFVRWKLVIRGEQFSLKCQFGLSMPGTNGFSNEQQVEFSGTITQSGNYFFLYKGDETLHMLRINSNLFHLLDARKEFLVGNGSYSYVLNIDTPVKSDDFSPQAKRVEENYFMAFEGRTPCQELSRLLKLNRSPACNKMKWYIILFKDPSTNQPSYYLSGGRGYKKQTMSKGNWEIIYGRGGRVIYKLDPEKETSGTYLLKADDNILFFSDHAGNVLVGDENFSYTLNRTRDREPE